MASKELEPYHQWYKSTGGIENWSNVENRGYYLVNFRGCYMDPKSGVGVTQIGMTIGQKRVYLNPSGQRGNVQYAGIEGGEHFIGPSLILLGQPLKALKPFCALGSKPGSSIASYTLSKTFPQTFTKVLGKQTGTKIATSLGTNIIGRAVGRFVPYVGWYLGENYGPSKWFTSEPPKSDLLEYMRENGMLDE